MSWLAKDKTFGSLLNIFGISERRVSKTTATDMMIANTIDIEITMIRLTSSSRPAARRFAARTIGDGELTQLAATDEQEAYIAFQQADSRSADVNILEGDANTFSIINRVPRRTY